MKIHKYKSSTLFKKYGLYFEYKQLLLMFGIHRILIHFIKTPEHEKQI